MDSRWFKDLNLKPETIEILEDNTGKNLIGLGRYWLRQRLRDQELKSKYNKNKEKR